MTSEVFLKLSNKFPEFEALCDSVIKYKEEYDNSYASLIDAMLNKLIIYSISPEEEKILLSQRVLYYKFNRQ